MRGPVKVQIGDQVEMRKPHPCGARVWEVTRLGMEIRLQCTGCGRKVSLLRARFDQAVRRIVNRTEGMEGWQPPR